VDLSKLPNAKSFISAYSSAYSGQTPPTLAALAYDAAMDEIAAIKSVISSGKTLTRAAVLAAVAGAPYAGVTGSLAFDKNGDDTTALGFSLYTTDAKGAWHFIQTLKG
jgi:ABC-type branched-subunit amino acid transport system substrate-binding protein